MCQDSQNVREIPKKEHTMKHSNKGKMTTEVPSSSLYTIDSVTSQDGTTIGYRQLGHGPGLLLVHGGMMTSQNFLKLATALSNEFTVYVYDRRGRGLSGSYGENYSMKKECEDLDALL